MAAKSRPEVVLLDLGLPVLNGFEVARKIREMHGGEAMTLIAVSGYGSSETRQETVEAGFNAHFVKPVDLPTIINCLKG